MKKKYIIISALVVVFAALIILLALPKKRQPLTVDPAFKEYVNAFSSGVLSRHSTIRVQLNHAFADSSMFNKPVEEPLFQLSPSVEGQAFWVDPYTVEFRPDAPLRPNEIYHVHFHLSQIMQVPSPFETMAFSFHTIKPQMEVSTGNMVFLPGDQTQWLTLRGKVVTSDLEDLETVAKTLVARQDGNRVKIKWDNTGKSKVFNFRLDSLRRKDIESSIQIHYNGSAIGSNQRGTLDESVTARDVFILRSATAVQSPEKMVIMEFSDPVDAEQDFTGLIRLGGHYPSVVVEGNLIKAYPRRVVRSNQALQVHGGLINTRNKKLNIGVDINIHFEDLKPEIRIKGSGVILPASNNMMLPFEAVNLKAADITIYQVYEDNILQFLQTNNLDASSQLSQVARIAYKGTIHLNKADDPVMDYGQWNNFTIDLSQFIKVEPGALYRVVFNMRREYSTYNCQDGDTPDVGLLPLSSAEEDQPDYDDWGYHRLYSDFGHYPSDYTWRERDNPCHSSYYYRKSYSRNILASDLSMIAKRGSDGKTTAFVIGIPHASPLSGVEVVAYNYQQQVMERMTTDRNGRVQFQSKSKPFVLVARHNEERAYLKMNDGLSNSLSHFDVSGTSVNDGLKGFIYGERDVWRPGDTLFISFMLEDKDNTLPKNLPVVCALYTPRGQLYERRVNNSPVNRVYTFPMVTDANAETGRWRIEIKAGGTTFSRFARIETIVPNRLKIDLSFPQNYLTRWDPAPGEVKVAWLHGGIASNLHMKTEVTLRPVQTKFNGFDDYVFDDPAKPFRPETFTVFDGRIDQKGYASLVPDLQLKETAPGILNARFETEVMEEGGRSSIHHKNMPYYPYRSYAGIKAPGGEQWHNPLTAGIDNIISLANVEASGAHVQENRLRIDVFKLTHNWWYDYSGSRLQNLISRRSDLKYSSETVDVSRGKATYTLNVNRADHGRYFIRVLDMTSGHSSGKLVYVAGHRARMDDREKDFASLLLFNSDKEAYKSGEEVTLMVPSSAGGKLLVSIENGMRVLETHWVDTEKGETRFSFTATEEMVPGVYAHVTLIQPHRKSVRDLPIRLYGVIPIEIGKEEFALHPQIRCDNTFRPESTAHIRVSEKEGKAMTYTLAVVDEGLLDLTGFETPDPLSHFYRREAIGVTTWDLYDYVMGSFDGIMHRILRVGGGGYAEIDPTQQEVNRFKPVVRFLGPFTLEKGKENSHQVHIPQYVGSLRIMVVSSNTPRYGHAEKTVKVKSPLMVLGTLPRILSPGETFDLPANVFAMEEGIRNVDVRVEYSDIFEPLEGTRQSLVFANPSDQLAHFPFKVKEAVGSGKIEVIATSRGHTARHTIEISVENPNPYITETQSWLLEGEQQLQATYTPLGMTGTNSASLEVSSIPPIDLARRLDYLIRYPYGCTEQIVASAFPQLFLETFITITDNEQQDMARNVTAAIEALSRARLPDGGFSYWPGSNYVNEWSSVFSGHFLLTARDKGYDIPQEMLSNWISRARTQAQSYGRERTQNQWSALTQAYRLYTLAASGAPETGAMNRLRESKHLKGAGQWMLAAAYAKAGMTGAARQILRNSPEHIEQQIETNPTLGCRTRDYSILAKALIITEKENQAFPYIQNIAQELSSSKWMSTQSIAFSLIAMNTYLKNNAISEQMVFSITRNGTTQQVSEEKPLHIVSFPPGRKQNLTIDNPGGSPLHVRLVSKGQPMEPEVQDQSKNLDMDIKYIDLQGNRINTRKLTQGTRFMARVTVKNPSHDRQYSELALEQAFPSGWEITGMRLQDEQQRPGRSNAFTYQDIRDDRVHTFFNLQPGQSKTFTVNLMASYLGKYFHPVNTCAAMYNDLIYARKSGFWVEVVRP